MRESLRYLKSRKVILGCTLAFCLAVIITRWLILPMPYQMFEPRGGIYGDVWSCMNVKSAATYFRDHGFAQSAGLPVFAYDGRGTEKNTYVYTHYPPLPDEIAGLTATATGSVDTRVLSIPPLLLSLAFFGLIFIALQVFNPANRLAALLAGIFTVISAYYVCWADDIHQHVYGEFCKWLYVLLLYLYYQRPGGRRGKILAALCFLAFINTWITFEHILYYGIVTLGFSIIFERKVFTRTVILLALMPLLGLGFHLLQNYLYFGNWDKVRADMAEAFIKRTTGHENDVHIGTKEWAAIPSKMEERMNRMYFIGYYPTIGLALIGFIKLWHDARKLFWMGIILLIASASWIFFMTQHWYIHYFTIRHFALFYAFIISCGIAALVQYYAVARRRGMRWAMVLCIIAGLACFIPSIESHFYYAYSKFAFMYPGWGTDPHYY